MGGMKISELDFVRLLPVFMRDDEAVIALSNAVNTLLGEPGKRLHTIKTWDKIDDLNEAECDELAWELDIDWYDSTGMGLKEKRETIKLAQQIKRKRGTKWAVEHLISAYFGEGYVVEWFEKEGRLNADIPLEDDKEAIPYTFKVLTTNAQITAENYDKFVVAAKAAKNERSHIVGIFYLWQQGPDPGVEFALGTSLHRYDYKKCTGTKGFIVKAKVETEPEAKLYSYNYIRAGETTCSTRKVRNVVGAAIVGKAVISE